MGEIVDLKPQQIVWRCACGCLTFYLHENSRIECAACHKWSTSASGEWRRNLPDNSIEVEQTSDDDEIVINIGDPKYALKRVLKSAETRTPTAVIVLFQDGVLRVWGEHMDTEERQDWFMRRCRSALDLLRK